MERNAPEVLKKVSKPEYVESMVQKYVTGVIDNVVAFRNISRIARADRAGVDRKEAVPVLIRLVKTKDYSVKDAYQDTVQAAYERRDLLSRIEGITQRLASIKNRTVVGADMRRALQQVQKEVERILAL